MRLKLIGRFGSIFLLCVAVSICFEIKAEIGSSQNLEAKQGSGGTLNSEASKETINTLINSNDSESLQNVRIQLKWFHQFQFAGYYAALEKGFYLEEGLDVELLERDISKSVIEKVIDGDVDFGVSDSSLMLAKLNGKPVTLLAQYFQHSPLVLMSLKESQLTSPFHFKGKRLMLDTKGGEHSSVVAMLLDELGTLDAIEEVEIDYKLDSLTSGKVDGIVGYLTSQVYDLKLQGREINILDPRYYGHDFYGDNLFTSSNDIAEKAELIDKVKKATYKGWIYALNNKEEIIQLIINKYTSKHSEERLLYEANLIEAMINRQSVPLGTISSNRLKSIAATFKSSGLASQSASWENFVYQAGRSDINPGADKYWLGLTAEEEAWLEARTVIRVMNEPDYVPYDFTENGKPTGFSVDYVKLIAEKLGIEIVFVKDDFANLIRGVKNKEIDLMHSLFLYPESRKEFLNFTRPYKDSINVIVTRRGEEVSNGLKDLVGKKMANVPGDAASGLLEEKFPGIRLVNVVDYEEALVAVAMGRADATILELPTANYLIKKLFINNLSVASELKARAEIDYRYRLAVRKDWPEFVPILEKAMDAVTFEEMTALEQKWLGSMNQKSEVAEQKASDGIDYILTVVFIIVALIVISSGLFYWLDKVKYTPEASKFSSLSGLRVAIGFNIALVTIVVFLGGWALSKIKENILDNVETSLATIKRSTLESLNIWVEDRKRELSVFANDSNILFQTQLLLGQYTQNQPLTNSQPLAEIRKHFRSMEVHADRLGFFIIALDGKNIASMRDQNIGLVNLIKQRSPYLFERAKRGETVFVPPIPSDVELDNVTNIKGQIVPPTMFLLHPIKADGGDVIALLAERFNPFNKFSQITQLGRIGESGETYTFSKEGLLLSRSRFQGQLMDVGLIDSIEQSILSVEIRDPGKELSSNEFVKLKGNNLPLTKMASSAISGNSGSDTKGYRDYRGVKVVGTWSWDNQLGIGIATEMDFEEALKSYTVARNVVFTALAITVAISATLSIVIMLFGRRTNRIMMNAQQELEVRVEERTEELRKSEERFELAMRGANDGLWDWNFENGEVFYSNRWVEMLGYEEGELAPTLETWTSLCHPEDSREALLQVESCELGEQDSFSIEFRMAHKDGHWVPILSRGYAVRNPETNEVTRFVGTHIDLTERKDMETELLKAKDLAEAANKAKSEFLAGMSHEIRTPMNGVIGMLRQILNDSLPEKQKERAEIAQSSATSLLTLINDILDFSKIEAGKLSLEKTDFNLKDVIIETIRSFNATAEEKGLELKTDFSCVSRHHFIGDPGRIRQILVNLIGNALKFTEEGFVLISADCRETEDGNWVFTCSVKDSGIGIPEEKLGILFNSFTQVDASTTRKFGGTGLGLAISSQLSRLMGGGVSVESELGKGSLFTFTVRLEA